MFIKLSICLFFISFISFKAQADLKPATAQQIQGALNYLDKSAKRFDSLKCSSSDEFCWWFLFHLKIGDSGNASMIQFAQKVPIRPNGDLFGEGHIFQYPAYWLLKSVPSNTQLSNGLTVSELIKNKDWLQQFQTFYDKEPSWYLIGSHFYKDLPVVQAKYSGELACAGSHYLIGLYNTSPILFERQLSIYLKNLYQTIKYSPDEVFADSRKADLIMHSFETLCLTGHRELIQADLFYYNLAFLEYFANKFENTMSSASSFKDIVNSNSEMSFAIADMLGHFRYGLKVCAELEPERLKEDY